MASGNSRLHAAASGLVAGTLGGAVGGMSVLVVSMAAAAVMALGRPMRLTGSDLGNLIYFPLAALILSSLTAVVGMVVGAPAGLIGGTLAGGPLSGTRYRRAVVAGISVGALGVVAFHGLTKPPFADFSAAIAWWGAVTGTIASIPAVWVTLATFNVLVGRRWEPPTNSATTPPPTAGDASRTPPAAAPRSTG